MSGFFPADQLQDKIGEAVENGGLRHHEQDRDDGIAIPMMIEKIGQPATKKLQN